MAHPLHHAASSARRYGGQASDYEALHSWFDVTKAHLATPQHRALRHHCAGIFEAEQVFGPALTGHVRQRGGTWEVAAWHDQAALVEMDRMGSGSAWSMRSKASTIM